MLEVTGYSDLGPTGESVPSTTPAIPLGEFRLRGEIVDSKCFLGVMKPGSGKAHRDCAVRCISGGAPPLFVLRSNGEPQEIVTLWLSSRDGDSLVDRILDFVAEPVELSGQVTYSAGGLRFTVDPDGIRRVGK
ncbi:MAG: hypothetical protein R2862_11570 [Thermoanaerobaculia bacterium]